MKNETANIETVATEVKQLGRPVNPSSERQKRLAELAAKAEQNGGSVKRGRPVNGASERQKRLAELEAKRANGELKRGRPAMIKVAIVETPVAEAPVATEE